MSAPQDEILSNTTVWKRVKTPPKGGVDVLVCNNNTGEKGVGDWNQHRKWSIQGSNFRINKSTNCLCF